MDDKFATWLVGELEDRNWSMSELGRRAKLSHSTISNLISGARGRGEHSCRSVAEAFGVSPEMVFRLAGLLPPTAERNSQLEELNHATSTLDHDDLQDVIEYAKMRQRRKEENKTHQQQSSRSIRPARTAIKDIRTNRLE